MSPRRAWLVAGALAFDLGVAGLAQAEEVDQLGGRVTELDARMNDISAALKPPAEPGPEIAERRLIDAQVLYELKNYEAASIILFDVVEKYSSSRAYPEALYYLADSLYLKRDFLSSRRFFEKIVDAGQTQQRYPEALQRLIELSLHTGDYTPVDGYLGKLDAISVSKPLPSVPYVKGKYFFFRQQFDKAIEAFKPIGPDHVYYYHALYFVGSTYVAMGPDKYDDAIVTFSTLLKNKPKTASQKLITELAHLALARIFLERGQLTQSLDEYSQIPQKSDQFNDMLYESAWVAIKGKDYTKARRQLDLLLLNAPDSPLAPEVKLLTGSLHIRQQQYGPATDHFTKTRDDYEPVYKLLESEVKKLGDAPAYFRELIKKNLTKFDISQVLPGPTVRWVKDEPEMIRLQTLIGDETDLKKSLDDSEEIVRRLEKALNGPARVNVFPDLAAARAKATEIANALTEAKQKLAARESQLIAPVVGAQKDTLDQLERDRARLEKLLAGMPGKAAAIQERQAKARGALNELDKRASEMSTEITGLEKSFDATRRLYQEAMKLKPEAPAPRPESTPPVGDPGMTSYTAKADELMKRLEGTTGDITSTRADLEKLKTLVLEKPREATNLIAQVGVQVEKLRVAVEAVRRDILEAASSIGVDDAEMQAMAKMRTDYEELLKRQHALVIEVQQRLGGGDRAHAEQIQSILDRARAIDNKIAGFNARIDEILDVKLKDIISTLSDEKAKVATYKTTLGGLNGETGDVGGNVMADNMRTVSTRFYNIVVRADVGIIDVAWALKDASTREGSRLVNDRKRELRQLDDDYKEVLKEQP